MEALDFISENQRQIVKIYKTEKLTSLSSLENDSINGKQIYLWHSAATQKPAIKHGANFDYQKNLDDLLAASNELIYFIAHLFLYRPYLNDPIQDGYPAQGTMIYPNCLNLAAARYFMYTDVVGEKLYNFWDRIGDLIASLFPERLDERRVFFASAIEAIPAEFQNGPNYSWLKSFKENEYVKANDARRQIVHYRNSNTTYMYDHLKIADNKEEIEKWKRESYALADRYKMYNDLALTGFEKTLLFIEEISPVLFPDIE